MQVSLSTKWAVTLMSVAALGGCQPSTVSMSESEETPAPAGDDDRATAEAAEEVAEPAETAASYSDGTYRAQGGYQSPNGPETIEVSITVEAGVVSAVEVTPQATSSTSQRYQGNFAGGIAGEVVGKSLDEADVDRVAGSSLTGGGFTEALESIRQDAKAS